MGTLGRSASRILRTITIATAVVSILLGAVATAASAAGPTTWHRLNPGDPPEHERYACRAGEVWHCRYDKLPERDLGFAWNQTRGVFTGEETTFACPAWFSDAPCDAADTVITGVGTFWTYDYSLRPTGSFDVDQQLLISDDGTLWIYWIDQFVCPWYPTFAEALANDPSCEFAP
jgi:hypothetical protein